jgi:hypothetical protein
VNEQTNLNRSRNHAQEDRQCQSEGKGHAAGSIPTELTQQAHYALQTDSKGVRGMVEISVQPRAAV